MANPLTPPVDPSQTGPLTGNPDADTPRVSPRRGPEGKPEGEPDDDLGHLPEEMPVLRRPDEIPDAGGKQPPGFTPPSPTTVPFRPDPP